MSFKEKMRLRLPAYLIFSFLAFLGVVSLWLPRIINERIENAQALTYSTTSTLFSVPQDSKNKMIAVGNTFYLIYTSSTYAGTTSTCGPAGSCNLYITTSTNGISWSNPRLVASGLETNLGNNEGVAIGDIAYNTRQGYLAVLYEAYSNKKLYVATSTNGVTWTSAVVVSSNGSGLGVPSPVASIAFATNTDLAAVTVRNGSKIILTTTTNPLLSVWPTSSTIQNVSFTDTGTAYLAEAYGTAIEGSAGAFTIHTIVATASTSPGYCITHYKTVNLGASWTSSSIHSCTAPADANVLGNELQRNSASVDRLGHPTLLYYVTTGLDMGSLTVSTTIRSARLSADGSAWTTTTLAQDVGHVISFSFPYLQGGGAYTYNNTSPILFFSGTSSNPYLSINTSTFITERVNTGALNYQSRSSVALNTSSQVLGMAYVSGYQLRFVTSTLRDTSWNTAPTSTAITPVFATSGTGYVTVTTTISDSEADEATVYVDYSLNGGTTWASSTLVTASAQTGSVTATTGRITGVSTASSNPISFTWDTKTDGVTATTTAMIRIAGGDIYTFGNYRMSATFTIDNVPSSAPASQTISVNTSTASFSWSDVSDAGAYTVSSTAGAASTTLSTVTTTSYIGLAPNTLYSFQVRVIDAYGNTSTFSSASSTYTDPVAVTSTPTAGSATETSLTVSWTDGVNGSGTVYQLYNTTAEAVVVTTTATSYAVTGLTAATSYQFQVRVQYLASSTQFTDYSATSTAVSTSAATSNSSSSSNTTSGSAASAPAAPSMPAVIPVTPQTSETNVFVVGAPQPLTIGGASHTVLVQRASDVQATVEVRSNPIVLTLSKGEKQAIDTDEDGVKDVLVAYAGLAAGKPQFTFTNLTDVSQTKSAFTINAGAYETDVQQVRLDFNVPGAIQVAVSNDASFAAAEFKTYQKNIIWQLPAGQGAKTLYARFRTSNGGIASVQDSITLTTSGYSPVVTPPVSSDTSVNLPAVYQFTKNLYVGARGADVTALQNRLKTLGFMADDATGFYGKATAAAVKKFQAANKISQTGGAGPATRAALNQSNVLTELAVVTPVTNNEVYQFTKNLYVGARGADVTALQNRLKTLGFMADDATGFYGKATAAAVKKFQAANKISQTGGAGPATRAALNR